MLGRGVSPEPGAERSEPAGEKPMISPLICHICGRSLDVESLETG